ncbi:hypothetical protein [Romboutsia ilealis]|nr:hypothetical protein [Romboutsia ilealis]
MSNTKQSSITKNQVPLNESGTRVHQTPSAVKLGIKQPPKSK